MALFRSQIQMNICLRLMEHKMFFTLCLALFFSTMRCRDVQDFTTKTLIVGEDVTLKCKLTAKGGFLFWKKLVPGNLPEVLGATYTFNHVGVTRRPRIETKQEPGAFVLRITQTELSDTAFYYCEEVAELKTTLLNITLLRIKGPETEITAIIQYFGADPVGAENSVMLQFLILSDVQNKTCPGGHKVLWLTPESNKSHPSVVYVGGNSGEEWDRGPDADPPQKCVHHLSRLDINSSNAGTFYCAVATCGEITFKNGVKKEINNEAVHTGTSAAVPLLSAALALSLIVIILLLYSMKKNQYECFKAAAAAAPQEDVETSAGHQQSDPTDEEGLVYSVPNFRQKKQSHSAKRDTSSAEDQSIYAEVKNQE